ncbi:MAG: ABC transporter permease [Phenylobacterium sp.]|jgi:putative ABC transport system permease protein|uniref:ABC transporter permease n=1 Tax=Phenylobacterium sp. TaxID=1871053 RepID=UPI0025F47E02|nr:ABC transporter permease [Phenylobacterium sp.]MCA6297603.1 ABC transporter permease [Phenylobacterium sp.]
MSLALATLTYEWRRYLAAVLALAFSGVLILAQVGLIQGLLRAFTATIDRSPAEIIILPPKAESLMGSTVAELPARLRPQMWLHPEVTAVDTWEFPVAEWVNIPPPGGRQVRTFVRVSMADPAPGSVTLPVDFPDSARQALAAPLSVVADVSALGRLGVKVGDPVILRGQTLQVRATVNGYSNVELPTVFVSRDTLIRLKLMTSGDKSGLFLLKLRSPEKAAEVRDFLNAGSNGEYRAWLREDLSRANGEAFMKEQIVGLLLGFAMVIAILIGVGITSQTLRGAVASNIREFASLRALGVSMPALRGVVVELSFWVGIAGLLGTAALMGLVMAAARAAHVALSLPLPYVGGVALLLMAISLVSGFLSLGALARTQPAELLR